MDYRFQYWLRTGLSGILLTLVICNIWINLDNIERQREVSARQSLILQAQQVDLPIYRALAQALVEVARKGDKQIEFLLAGEKISIAPQQSPGNQLPAGQGGSTPPNEGAEREGIRPGRPRGRP